MSPKVSVRFPNFFEGRLSEYPILNEHYTSIQHDLEDDLIRYGYRYLVSSEKYV
jgi:hypothetical protein